MSKLSKLVQDLSELPNIIGNLGLSIAAAQRAFNLDYIESMERLVAMAKELVGQDAEGGANADLKDSQLSTILRQISPSRYQYTETELEFRADLAQTKRSSVSAGLGIGVGAIAVNASFTSAYGYDYRASARVRTVIHARDPEGAAFQQLLDRAKDLGKQALELPATSTVDKEVLAANERIFKQITGKEPPEKVTTSTPAEGD